MREGGGEGRKRGTGGVRGNRNVTQRKEKAAPVTGKDEMAASSGGLQVDKEKSPAAEERTITAARNSNMMRASAGKAGDGRKRKRKSGKR